MRRDAAPTCGLLLCLVVTATVAACGQDQAPSVPPASAAGAPPQLVVASEPGLRCDWARVLEIVDGDTLHALVDGKDESIRLIGVDAPELHHPTRGEEPFGREAMDYVDDAVGDWVCLESDITNRDQYGRLLRYVWLPDGQLLNEALVAAGLAQVSTFPPDVRHLDDRYLPAQAAAQAAGLAIWSGLTADQCDPAYPDVCIPPRPPDLDCEDIEYRRFRVLPPDPHNFDADGNGVGCEGS